MIKILFGNPLFSRLFLSPKIYLLAAFWSFSVVAGEVENAATETGLMDKLGLESFAPDQSEWSEKASANYEKAKDSGGEPLAVLVIDRLNITAPAYLGTGRFTLDRGIGLLESGASPGEEGNIALSGHRDGFFRPLKDIQLGDMISLYTLDGEQDFVVSELKIVDALDISVLDDTGSTLLTLITCHPFYFVGYAPDRFIVKATPVDKGAVDITKNSALSAAHLADGGNYLGTTSTE